MYFFSLNATADEDKNNHKKVEITSKVVIEIKKLNDVKVNCEIILEHPRIYLGPGYSNGYSYKGVSYPESYTLSFDGLFVRVDAGSIYINQKKFAVSKIPKKIWISDDFEIIKIDDEICKFQKILKTDTAIETETFDERRLDNGVTLEFKGGLSSGSMGVSIDSDHCILNQCGTPVKVWGDTIYIWDNTFGKISELKDENNTITIDFLKLIK